MKPNLLTHALGATLICFGLAACEQETGVETAQTPYVEPAPATTPAEPLTPDPYGTTADPYATTPQIGQDDALTGNTDFSGNQQTTGDTLGDRCAGLTGAALTECLETERLRRMDDPTQDVTTDVPNQ